MELGEGTIPPDDLFEVSGCHYGEKNGKDGEIGLMVTITYSKELRALAGGKYGRT